MMLINCFLITMFVLQIIRAHNFPLGVAVLVRGEDDSEGCVGRVEAIEKGRLRIRTADDPAGKILPPDSPQLLPLCKPGGAMAITAISDTANSAGNDIFTLL